MSQKFETPKIRPTDTEEDFQQARNEAKSWGELQREFGPIVPLEALISQVPQSPTNDWANYTECYPLEELPAQIELACAQSLNENVDPVLLGSIAISLAQLEVDEGTHALTQAYETRNAAERLDFISFIPTLAAFAAAHGDRNSFAILSLKTFLANCYQPDASLLTQRAVRLAMEETLSEDFAGSIWNNLEFDATLSRGRLATQQFLGDRVDQRQSTTFEQVAKDIKITRGKSGLPNHYVVSSSQRPGLYVEERQLLYFKLALAECSQLEAEQASQELAHLTDEMTDVLKAYADTRRCNVSELVQSLDPAFRTAEWKSYLDDLDNPDHPIWASQRVSKALQEYLDKLAAEIPQYLTTLDDQLKVPIEFIRGLHLNIMDASSISQALAFNEILIEKILEHESAAADDILDAYDLLRETLSDIGFELGFIEHACNSVPDLELESPALLVEKLQELLDNLENVQFGIDHNIDRKPFTELANDPELFPFGGMSDSDALFLRHMYREQLFQGLEDDLCVSLRELPFRSQVNLIHFSGNHFERLNGELQKHPGCQQEMLACFFANAQSAEYCELLFSIADTVSPEDAKVFFKKYTAIIDQTENLWCLTNPHGTPGYNEKDTREHVVRDLLGRANQLLKNYCEYATRHKHSPEHFEMLIQSLHHIREEVALTASRFKGLRITAEKSQAQAVSLEQFKELSLEVKAASTLDGDDRSEMIRIARHNWLVAAEDNSKLSSIVLQDLEASFNSVDTQFYIVRQGDEIVMFRKVVQLDENTVYFGSFNVTEEAQLASLAGELNRIMLEKYQNHAIELNLSVNNPAISAFENKYGFTRIKNVRLDATGPIVGYLFRREPDESPVQN